jgi:hypothetical protein
MFNNMNESDYKIVRITNITDFDFTGKLGARFNGRDFFVPAGGSLLVPLTVGNHLAMHLARQIMIKKAPLRNSKEIDGRGSDRPLWDDSIIEKLKLEIMTEVYEEEPQESLSEADRMIKRVEELNKVVANPDEGESDGNTDTSGIVPVDETNSAIVYQDKAEVIAALKEKGISFDARLGKAKLTELLTVQ